MKYLAIIIFLLFFSCKNKLIENSVSETKSNLTDTIFIINQQFVIGEKSFIDSFSNVRLKTNDHSTVEDLNCEGVRSKIKYFDKYKDSLNYLSIAYLNDTIIGIRFLLNKKMYDSLNVRPINKTTRNFIAHKSDSIQTTIDFYYYSEYYLKSKEEYFKRSCFFNTVDWLIARKMISTSRTNNDNLLN